MTTEDVTETADTSFSFLAEEDDVVTNLISSALKAQDSSGDEEHYVEVIEK